MKRHLITICLISLGLIIPVRGTSADHSGINQVGADNFKPYKPISDVNTAKFSNLALKPVPTPSASQKKPQSNPAPSSGNCGDNMYKQFIYQHESGCNPAATNAGGCRGIGQACPGSKLPCGADFACQDKWFTNYAISTYGGWAQAYNAWKSQGWW